MDQITWHGKVGLTEASDMGFPPGHWPTEVNVEGTTFKKVTGEYDGEGEVTSYLYRASDTRELRIFND